MTDLDVLLRETLCAHAATITSGPSWDAATAEHAAEVLDLIPPLPQRRPPRAAPIAVLVAAAVIIAVAVGVLVGTRHGHAPNRAANSAPPGPSPTITRSACRTTLPTTWRDAANAASTPIRDGNALDSPQFWGTTSDGEAVVEYGRVGEDGPHLLVDHVGLLAPGSADLHELARVSSTSGGLGLTVSIDQNLIVIAVEEGKNSTDRYSRILALDAQTGVLRTVANVPRDAREQLTGAAYPLAGHVYWQTTTGKGPDSYRIREVDMTTGRRSVAARGVFDIESSAAGLAWSLTPWRLDRPTAMPPAVRVHVNELSYDSFVTDGTSYAWQSSDGAVDWWSPSAGRVVRVPNLLARPFSRSEPGSVFSVAGPIVTYQPPHSSAQRVLDVRTGATAPISSEATVRGRFGHLVGDPLAASAFGGRLMRLDASGLPALHC
jgi:hypothetical protein